MSRACLRRRRKAVPGGEASRRRFPGPDGGRRPERRAAAPGPRTRRPAAAPPHLTTPGRAAEMGERENRRLNVYTQGVVTSQSLWSRHDRHFLGITSGVLGGIRGYIRGYTPYTNLRGFFGQRILTSVITNKQGTFRPFATPLCVYSPPFLAIHHWV